MILTPFLKSYGPLDMATIDQYKKFVANEPEAQREVRTLEIYHPDFSQIYRFANQYDDFTATLETTAPRNAGEDATFTASTLLIEEPAERNDADQVISVTVGATDDVLAEIIDQVSGSGFLEQIQVCLLYTSPSPRDRQKSRMPSSA